MRRRDFIKVIAGSRIVGQRPFSSAPTCFFTPNAKSSFHWQIRMVSPPFIHACDKTYFDGINTSHEHNGDRRSWQQQILALAARNALPTSFSNVKTAKALGLTIPPSMLALTTMLIE